MDKSPAGPDLPLAAVYWAMPTKENLARYLVDFRTQMLLPEQLQALKDLVQRHGGFKDALLGPALDQATVILNQLDEDYSRLDWLKQQLQLDTRGTVIADLYAEVTPVTAHLRALGAIQFDVTDLPLIAGLPGVASVKLVSGQVVVLFDQAFVDVMGIEQLCASFMGQSEFATTVVVHQGPLPTI